jgi:hypothetical protein
MFIDFILVFILAMFIGIIYLHYYPIREGATLPEPYDETSCKSIASQNKINIDSLQKDVTKLLKLQDKVKQIENSNNANTTQLSSLTDQVFKTK